MAPFQPGEKPWNWRGEPIVEPRGYVLIFVGKDHPLADCRGYTYQHRLEAQATIDRPLTSADIVHHRDEAKNNNDPQNLVVTDRSWHRVEHRRRPNAGLRLPGEPNPLIECACGCGTSFFRYDDNGRPRRYVSGHNPPVSSPTLDAVLAALRNSDCPMGPSQIAALIGKHASIVQTALWKLSARQRVTRLGRGKWSVCS